MIYLLLVAGLGYLIYLLSPILAPFLMAAGLAYLCDPLVDRLETRKISRTLGTALVMLGLLLLGLLLIAILAPLVQAQVRLLMAQIPQLVLWAQNTVLPWLQANTGVDVMTDQAEVLAWLKGHTAEIGKLTAYLPELGNKGLALIGVLTSLLMVPVVTFYLLRDWDSIMANLGQMLPAPIRPRITAIVREIDVVLSEFVRGQLAVMAIMALFYSLGLWLAGLDYALAVGMTAGILVFVPYLGVIVGVLLGTLAGFGQSGDVMALIPIWAVFGIGQLLEGVVITPWLVGERVGLHPVAIIFALMAFGQLFGFFGVLLAIPAAAALLVGLRHLKAQLDQI